eukprot:TRINITY_DN7_c0_g1_i1.p1 TRINITY_DN7_c0_g1~~TRINITY_DN7_c0_g1_i1.p1  ORF type:complete len:224 (-),score=64.73 TRINITY_DN7_c0_g1_i1:197-868(-)
MSKISRETLSEAIQDMVKQCQTKKRGFTETVELQIALKNYDPQKDKRFSGVLRLPHVPRPKFSVCILGDAKHIDDCKAAKIPCLSADELQKIGGAGKNKKAVKKLAQQYDSFLASATLIRRIPRLVGPGLNKAGKFPSVLNNNEEVSAKVEDQKASIKFQLKSKKALCMGVAVGHVAMSESELAQNITLAVNYLVSLLTKNWQQVKRLYIKSTMGPSHRIYGF